MRHRAACKLTLAVATIIVTVVCIAADAHWGIALTFVYASAALLGSAFGQIVPAAYVENLLVDLRQARLAHQARAGVTGRVASVLAGVPVIPATSWLDRRFAVVFRDEVASVRWRSLTTELRSQRRRHRTFTVS